MRDITAAHEMGDNGVELAQLSVLVLDGGAGALVQRHQHELLGDVQSQQLDLLHAQPTQNTQHLYSAQSISTGLYHKYFLSIASPVSSTVIQHSKAFILALPQGVFHLFFYLINGHKHTMYFYWLYKKKFFISVIEHSKLYRLTIYWLVQSFIFPQINCPRAFKAYKAFILTRSFDFFTQNHFAHLHLTKNKRIKEIVIKSTNKYFKIKIPMLSILYFKESLTSGVPRLRYMRKRWKYCCRCRPCSDTSLRSSASTAFRMWSLRVPLGSAGWLAAQFTSPTP